MPETASTRTTDRDRLRSRLVSPRSARKGATADASPSEAAPNSGAAQARSAQFEQSPVLFRLPAIGLAESDDIVTTSELPHSRPASSDRASSLQSELRSDEQATLDIARVEPQPQFLPLGPQESEQLSPSGPSTEDAADQLQFQLPPTGPAEAAQAEPAQLVAAAPAVETNSEQRRTWWEHWSSGVVLILLVIALVVASIIALNDGSKLKPDQMAGQLDTPGPDEFDLSSIAIPDISMPPLSATQGRPLSSVAQNSPSPSSIAAPPSAIPPQPGPAVSDSAAVELPGANELVVELPVADNPALELAVVDAAAAEKTVVDEIVPDIAGQAATAIAAQATSESIPPLPLATLDRPTEVAALQLFTREELPGEAGSAAGTDRISGLPAGNPTVSLELPRTEVTRAEGSSPTFYDGAFMAGEQHAVSGATGFVDTNMPSIAAILASATTNADSGTASVVPMVTSATPDLNGESIVEAYLRFQQLHQATTGPASNRYPEPPAH